jgi:hypothetical protein
MKTMFVSENNLSRLESLNKGRYSHNEVLTKVLNFYEKNYKPDPDIIDH